MRGNNLKGPACLLHFADYSANLIQHHAAAAWWLHQMQTFSVLLAISAGNSPHKGQWRGALVNKGLSKQSWGWWFETPSHPLCRYSSGCLYMMLGTGCCVRDSGTTHRHKHLQVYRFIKQWVFAYAAIIHLFIIRRSTAEIDHTQNSDSIIILGEMIVYIVMHSCDLWR